MTSTPLILMTLTHMLVVLATLGVGAVYGTDVFFAAIGRRALTSASDANLTDVMGRLHEYGDARMPIFAATGMVSTLGLVFAAHLGTASSSLALAAFAALIIHLSLYLTVSKPINARLTEAAHRMSAGEEAPSDARRLQDRWDAVIVPRALLLGFAVLCLALAGCYL